ncbi:MAG TPA: ATP-binding cassette domain-containing protein [Anaerolineae bacterium]|nr:ATP-binding cassette domain-containing protein [Anaerolineae bacterium]
MNTVSVQNISKRFGDLQAVADVSLHVAPGEIFGLLGPNGAGKTTTIRMMLNLLQPDTGAITVFDGPMTEAKKNRIGYLPEERGLYADVKLIKVILYLARLKGLSRAQATPLAEKYLKQLDLWVHKDKKLKEMSRGMHQKAQFIATIIHDPDLIIIDEPFSGLDPVNTELIKRMLLQMRQDGKAIIMCTHQMHQVEQMCDRIGLISAGRVVLDGPVRDVRRRFAGNEVTIIGDGDFSQAAGAAAASLSNGRWHITLDAQTTPQQFLKQLAVNPAYTLEHYAIDLPSLHDIFIKVVAPPGQTTPDA